MQDDSSECNVLLSSLKDFTVSGSFIKLDVIRGEEKETVIVDNMALYLIYGKPRNLVAEEYVEELYTKIQSKEPLEVSQDEFNKLSEYFFSNHSGSDIKLEKVLSEYFKDGNQIKHSEDDILLVNILLDSNYQVWTDDFSGLLGIVRCETE